MKRKAENNLHFLDGGGEMGKLTREKDWSKTSLGLPEIWPQTLRLSLSLVLNNKFPMFIFWGPEHICFYNDAYRPSLGNDGKHPLILGMPGVEAWPEIWSFIKPLIDNVLYKKEAAWYEDNFLPIYRNGKLEDVYWTFSYSPIANDDGSVVGVMVTCTETTEKVNNSKKLVQSNNQFLNNIKQAPVAMCLFKGKDHVVEMINDRMLELWGKTSEQVLGLPVFEGVPEAKGQGFEQLMDHLFLTGEKFEANERPVSMPRNGKLENIIVNFVYEPFREPDGSISGLITVATEVTAQVIARNKIEESALFNQTVLESSPDCVKILDLEGKLTFINANGVCILEGNSKEDFLDRKWETMWAPEQQPVITDAIAKAVKGDAVQFIAFGSTAKNTPKWWDVMVTPLFDVQGKVVNILATSRDITRQKLHQQQLEQSEARFRSLIKQSPMAMVVLRGPQYIIEVANDAMLKRWGRPEEAVINKPFTDVFPEIKQQRFMALLNQVYKTGVGYHETEAFSYLLKESGKEHYYVNFEYSPIIENDGKVSGVIATVIDITDQVTARKQIEESEERYHNLIYSSPTAIAILQGEDFVVTIANDAIIEFWGKGKEIIGKPYFVALPELVDQGYKEVFAQVYKTGVPFNAIETPVSMTKNGLPILRYYNFLLYAQRNLQNEIDGIGIIATEVTSQALFNKQMQENEKRFRLLADSMPQYIWTADVNGNLNYYNQSVFDYSGLTLEQINKDGWLQIVHPDDREGNIKQWTEAVTTGNNFLFEHRFRRHDGEYRWQLSRAVPQRDEHGKIQGWVGTSTDIQEQKTFTTELEKQVQKRTKELKELNEELIKSESRYHLMVEEVQDYAILYLNRDGIVENWNTGAAKIKGYKASEIIGKNFRQFYTEQDRKNLLPDKLLELAAKTGKAVQEGWRVRKNGSLFWASVVITAVHNQENEVIGFSKVTHDLTDKKNAEDILKRNAAELEQKNIALESMNKELQSFAYISSHDLQEPLRKIQTFASRLMNEEKQNLTDQGKQLFERMQNAAERMQKLIDDLLAYSRTNTADRKYVLTPLNDIICEVKNDLGEELEKQHATIDCEGLCELPVILFQFRQLLLNLVSNSLKFAMPGRELHIKIHSTVDNGIMFNNPKLLSNTTYCHIQYTDNGIGFDQQYSEKIFELFQRLHGKQEYVGTGIGLSIVKKIVDNHNGFITATGKVNEGATFDIYVPFN